MKIKDLTTGDVFRYGSNHHHALRISSDGRTLSFEHLQNGDGSRYGNYRFVDDCEEKIPDETECWQKYGADSYFDIGGFSEDVEALIERLEDYMKEIDEMAAVDDFYYGKQCGVAKAIEIVKEVM